MAYKFKSESPSVATVTSAGKVTGVATGSTNIVVSNENDTPIARIPVSISSQSSDVRPTGISLNKRSVTVYTSGVLASLKATVTPANAVNKTVTWESLNPDIVSVHPRSNNTCEIWLEEGAHWGETTESKTATVRATNAEGHFADCTVTIGVKGTIIDDITVLDASTNASGEILVDGSGSTFRLKCSYHNVGDYYGGISLEGLGDNLSSYYGARENADGYTIIPITVKESFYKERTMTFKVRGSGAGDSFTTFTVRQSGGTNMYSISHQNAYFDAEGEHHFEDGEGNEYDYAQTLEYWCNPEVSKSIINDAAITYSSTDEGGWVGFNTSKWYCYKRTNGSISTMSNSEWNSFIQNSPADTMADCSIPVTVSKNTTGKTRTATIEFDGGVKFYITQGA